MEAVTVKELRDQLGLKVLQGEEYLDRLIQTSDISRPGLELSGYFNYYPSERVQLFGRNEHSYLKKMT
ncbi:HPr kinase/phosphorylase, partial [Streptococcus anginosus]|nr:HPr kinase/phosphorylase [Streptococcus anginosus]